MKELLNKYKANIIRPEELEELSSMIERTPDDTLYDILFEDWDSFASESENNHKVKENLKKKIFIAISCAAAILLALTLYLQIRLHESTNRLDVLADSDYRISTEDTGTMDISLPDGTTAKLFAKSSIQYSADYGQNKRMIKMTGEGNFDVAHNSEKTFSVSIPGMEIYVHGTKFNVYAYPDDEISEVSLYQGSLSISCGNQKIRLSPNQKVIVQKSTGKMTLTHFDDEEDMSLRKHKMVFIHKPLLQVLDALQARFGVKITSSVLDLSDFYTGEFREPELEDVLAVLGVHYLFDYEIKNGEVIITKKAGKSK